MQSAKKGLSMMKQLRLFSATEMHECTKTNEIKNQLSWLNNAKKDITEKIYTASEKGKYSVQTKAYKRDCIPSKSLVDWLQEFGYSVICYDVSICSTDAYYLDIAW